ncbi:Flap endonuclease 1 [Meloidogyne graminicola]|uniref:Flap endonuclease 1 n=1 Tax=Meloidogyne graminicola TaxID=189291 RepID=A0A8S9ZP01_9BILA|nr:Flap endonuclease 1 [Meloidogyne graminicola]
MGIKDLSKVIADNCPKALKTLEMKAYFGRKIAIDASMSLYQFLIAVRQDGAPVYVFDGKPPELKSVELDKRSDKRAEAKEQLAVATENGDTEAIEKYNRRLVTNEHSDDCKKLLNLMGVPMVEAPCEAEAQCAELVRKGVVYATATEDMDALTFGSPILVRHMTFSEAKKMPIKEFSLEKVLQGLEMTQEQFIDLCILLGCDYCGNIRGIGPKKSVELIKQYGSIEEILKNIDHKKFPPPSEWKYKEARNLFLHPNVEDGNKFEIVCILEHEDRIRSGLDRLKKSRKTAQQGRIDAFFVPVPVEKDNKRNNNNYNNIDKKQPKKRKDDNEDKKQSKDHQKIGGGTPKTKHLKSSSLKVLAASKKSNKNVNTKKMTKRFKAQQIK